MKQSIKNRIGKPCYDCSIELTVENIIKGAGNLLCKPCFNARQRRWRASTPDLTKARKARDYNKNKESYIQRAANWAKENRSKRQVISKTWRWKLRLEMISAYGGKCVCCGETIPEFLSIDHINNDGYEKRIDGEQSGAALYKALKRQGWPSDNYQLLCMNCNFAKGHFGACPHTYLTHPNTSGKVAKSFLKDEPPGKPRRPLESAPLIRSHDSDGAPITAPLVLSGQAPVSLRCNSAQIST
jgi:hypothetical protein